MSVSPYPKETLAIYGGTPALPAPPRTRMPVSDTLRDGVIELIQNRPLSSLFGEGEVETFEAAFAEYLGKRYAVAVNSGTSSLHTALTAVGIGAGDEVAVTAFSFVASASVIVQTGARPIFVDIDPQTLGLDLADLKTRISKKTKAVIPAHIFGIPGDISGLRKFCDENGLLLIEDACQALGARVGGRGVGAYGDIGCFSFNVKKIIQTGEGGMLVTDNPSIAEAAREIRVNGLSIFGVERLGFNYTLTNLQAFLGYEQLTRLDEILSCRQAYAERIKEAIRDYVEVFDEQRSGVVPVPYAVPFKLSDSEATRRNLIVDALSREGVPVSGVYTVLYEHALVFKQVQDRQCPVAEQVVPRLLSVNPSHLYAPEDVEGICLGLAKVLSSIDCLDEQNW